MQIFPLKSLLENLWPHLIINETSNNNVIDMKIAITVFITIMLITSCEYQTKVYPDINPSQIGTNLRWGANISEVKDILTNNFKLNFSGEIKQSKENQIGRVYEFKGGTFGGIDTKNWIVILEYDSLISLSIKVENDNPQTVSKFLNTLTNALKRDSLYYPNDKDRWILEKDGKRVSEVQILRVSDNEVIVAYFKAYDRKF